MVSSFIPPPPSAPGADPHDIKCARCGLSYFHVYDIKGYKCSGPPIISPVRVKVRQDMVDGVQDEHVWAVPVVMGDAPSQYISPSYNPPKPEQANPFTMLNPAETFVPRGSIVPTLKAMASNYANGHSWDHLDGRAVLSAAHWLNKHEWDEAARKKAKNPEPSINELDRIQDYRFGSMVKSENYAFARGLTINPTHLPQALEAMRLDGWFLLAIFGQTNASDIGFIFERQLVLEEQVAPPPPPVQTQQVFDAAVEILVEGLAKAQIENWRLTTRVDGLLEANTDLVRKNREVTKENLENQLKLASWEEKLGYSHDPV